VVAQGFANVPQSLNLLQQIYLSMVNWLKKFDTAQSRNIGSRHLLLEELAARRWQSALAGHRIDLPSERRINAGTWHWILQAAGCEVNLPRRVTSIGTAIVLGFFAAASGASPSASTLGAAAPTASRMQTLECLLEPSLSANVGSSVDGVLEEVNVNRGDRVTKGQVVARLRSGVEAASLSLAQAQVEFAQRRAERNEELFKKQLISAQERDEMMTEVKLREEEVKRNQELLALRSIVSPLDGVVVDRKLTPGEFVRADKSVVARLARVDPLNVEVVAPAAMFSSLRVGMNARISIGPDFPGTFPAKIVVVDRVIDAASGTLGVRLEMPNPGNTIPAGLKCTVSFRR
jgi:RND family efflux transporter MFP subunit